MTCWIVNGLLKARMWLLLVGGFFVALVVAFFKGRSEGKRLMQAEQERARLESIKRRKELDHEVEELGPADVDREFAKWMRDSRG